MDQGDGGAPRLTDDLRRAPQATAFVPSEARLRHWAGVQRGHRALTLVAVGYTVFQLAFTARIGLGWDESVYLSQVARGVPAAEFTASRARGVPLLVAPVALFTPSVTAVRVYLSLLSGLGLFLAFRPWLRVRPGAVVPLAAALFAGLWLSLFYGNAAMPNLWVAYCGVAGAALAYLAGTAQPVLSTAGLVTAFAVASLLRPTDAVWLALPLLAHGLITRRPRVAVPVAAGLLVGWAEWAAEAFLRYGGPIERLRAAAEENAAGPHLSLLDHLRALDGPLLCRFGVGCGGYPTEHIAWFAAVPVLAVLGVLAGRRRRAFALALACGSSLALGYLLTVGYAAPRFLLPAYALLALPVAAALAELGRRRVTAVLAALGVLAYFALQGVTAFGQIGRTRDARASAPVVAARLAALGVRPPCFLYGHDAVQLGYLAGCRSHGVFSDYGGRTTVPSSIVAALGRGDSVGVVTPARRLPAPSLARWVPVDLGVDDDRDWHVFLPPPGGAAGPN